MLLVAFSRRICCSRVESVSTKPRRPSASRVSPHKPPRHLADVFLLAAEQPDVGPAELQPDADRLAFADDDVGAHFARRLDRAERDRFGHDRDQQRLLGLACLRQRRQIVDPAEDVGILHHDAAGVVVDPRDQVGEIGLGRQRRHRGLDHVAGIFRHRPRDRHVMRVDAGREQRLRPPRHPPRHADRFPARGRAVVHAGVRDVGPEQARDLRLELEQHLQRALRDLGLVRRVGGQELAALDQVIDRRRDVVAIRAAAEEERHVARDRRFCRASFVMCRSTASSLAWLGRSRIGPVSRASAGTSTNRSSIERGADDGEHVRYGLGSVRGR